MKDREISMFIIRAFLLLVFGFGAVAALGIVGDSSFSLDTRVLGALGYCWMGLLITIVAAGMAKARAEWRQYKQAMKKQTQASRVDHLPVYTGQTGGMIRRVDNSKAGEEGAARYIAEKEAEEHAKKEALWKERAEKRAQRRRTKDFQRALKALNADKSLSESQRQAEENRLRNYYVKGLY